MIKKRLAALIFGVLMMVFCGVASAQQSHSWTSRDKIALTYYFYWYNVHDGEHFVGPGGIDTLTDHPPDDYLADFSYTDVAWHQRQMQDMVSAGIDVALPVYWGNPQDLAWSQTGLQVMVTALQAMARGGTPFPGIGMFFDTTSLWKGNGLNLLDVTTTAGKATFYGMIHDYFTIVPKSLWATIDGRPIIVLYYSSWVAAYDQTSFDYISAHFQSDFGVLPYIVRERSWTGVTTDAVYAWGAALSGPVLVSDAGIVGPGYDDSAVWNRSTHQRQDRECSNFYQQAWDKIISGNPRLAFVETWNELHEATDIAATREYGRQYIDLTMRNITRWKSANGYQTASMIWFSPGRDMFESGLRIALNRGDGSWQLNRVAGRDAVDVGRLNTPPAYYIYLDVDDSFIHAARTPVWLTVEYLDRGTTPWRIEYDGANNVYTVSPPVTMGNTGLWKQVTFTLPDAYFGGRENAGTDLRIDDLNNTGEIHYFSRMWMTKAPPGPVVRLAAVEDVILTAGRLTNLPLTVSTSDGSAANLNLLRAPEFASLQSTNGGFSLLLDPAVFDAQACAFSATIVATNNIPSSLPDATSFKALVPKTTTGGTCDYKLSLGGQAFAPEGGTGAVTITTAAGCAWTVGVAPPGVAITGAASGAGPGVVTFQTFSNSDAGRAGSFTIAGRSFSIEQQAAAISGLSLVGSMPQIAAEANWTTEFTLVNKSAASGQARLSLFGDPSGPLSLPLSFPQQPPAPGPLLASSFDRTLAANACLVVDTAGPQTPPVLVGSAQLSAATSVDGFAIFHFIPGDTPQEAVVPLETRKANSYLLVFDNTDGIALGVALENVSPQTADIAVVIRDDSGVPIGMPGATITLAGGGHTSFDLATRFPITAGNRGTIEFDTPAGGQISALGIRFTPPNNALTTIPVLANVGTGGGSIAHLASGGGWQTTFVLVNTGSNTAEVHLKFFADVTGTPLSLPLSFPQSGADSATAASTVDRTLAAGASLFIRSTGSLSGPATVGSAQLSTNGNVSGFVIFRYNSNGQEAVVPFENRDASAYVLAFDNTAGTATGVAINSVSSQSVNVPVVIRDDTGAQIGTDTLNLAANGHLSFLLVTDKYPATANRRGTIEFVRPAGAQIGILGIRIPVTSTFTTLPALTK